MIGVAEISGAVGSLKAAFDIVKGLKSTADSVAINDAKIALQSAIIEAQTGLLAAQEAQTTNLRRIDELEQEVVRLKDWSAERERYELVGIRGGIFAYMPKAGMENGQPAHWLCTNCFEQGHRSIMQNKGATRSGSGEETYGCNRCSGTFSVSARMRPSYVR